LQVAISELQAENIPIETGSHSEKVYQCELMVISPGVPSDAPIVKEAEKRNIEIVSELECASWFCKAPIAAITGSNGKTTTTALLGQILADCGKGHSVAGNIGTAFSSVVDKLSSSDWAVIEVSSFQLDHIAVFRPKIAILLNITPDHMDRYNHSMEKYAASKSRIFEQQQSNDVLIYNTDDEWSAKVAQNARAQKWGFSIRSNSGAAAYIDNGILVTNIDGERHSIINIDDIFIKGMHNLYNAMAAALAARYIGVGPLSIGSTLRTFRGVEHRLEFVRKVNDVVYYNDSKATNVDSVWYALQAFQQPIILILGGRDKGNDYSRLKELVQQKVKAIIAIGESAEKVEVSFRGSTVIKKANSMDEAVSTARFLAQPGDVVLLSPACASFDWFTNYEHRGRKFKELVSEL